MKRLKKRRAIHTILFCPLDWGLGHIARDLPLIKEFLKNGHKVIVAASPKLIRWMNTECPEVETDFFPGPKISYGKNGFSWLKLIASLPGLLFWPLREKRILQKLIKKHRPSLIISDNRYGARNSNVFSVFITHQLMLKMPGILQWMEYPMHLFLKFLINNFDECWIPDFPAERSLAGDLVHKYKLPKKARLIGPLSRFEEKMSEIEPQKYQEDVLGIISGPEPQRTLLEQLLIRKFTIQKETLTLYTGKNELNKSVKANGISIQGHRPTHIIKKEILNHNKIISRSGYSTIMDMFCLGKNCLLIPTPGQTEQEYLASYHEGKDHIFVKQSFLSRTDERGQLTFPAQHLGQRPKLIFREKLKDFF